MRLVNHLQQTCENVIEKGYVIVQQARTEEECEDDILVYSNGTHIMLTSIVSEELSKI